MKYFSFSLLLLLCACYGRKPIKTGLEGQPMPALDLIALDSTTHVKTENIPAGKTTILFSFEPWCPYCKAQTEEMLDQIKSFKNANIYMLCGSPFPTVRKFFDHYQLSRYPNIKVVVDSSRSFRNYFNNYQIPFIAVYAHDNKLRQAFIGKSNIKTIAEVVEEIK